MAEVIHPSNVIEKFYSLIVRNDGFKIRKKSLLRAMGVKRESSNWYQEIQSILLTKGMRIEEPNTDPDEMFVFKPSTREVVPEDAHGDTGIERVISFITQEIKSHKSSFYISDENIHRLADGYFTKAKNNEVHSRIRPLGYEVIRLVKDWNNMDNAKSWDLHVCKLGYESAFSFEEIESKILSFVIDQSIELRKPKRFQSIDLSVDSIDWDELNNSNSDRLTPYSLSITDSSYAIPKSDVSIEDSNKTLIQSNSLKKINNLIDESTDNIKINDCEYDTISYWDENSIRNFNDRRLSFYIPFHTQSSLLEKENPNWGIYINLPLLFSSAISSFEGENRCTESLNTPKKEKNADKHKSLYWNLYLIFQMNYFKYQVESMATWFEIILHQAGNDVPLYKNYYKSINEIGEDPNIEDLAAEHYSESSLSHRSKNKIEMDDAKKYKEIISSGKYMSYKNLEYSDKYTSKRKASLAKMALAKYILGFDVEDNNLLAAISKHVLNGHATFHNKIDIPLYVVGNEEQIYTFERLFPSAQQLVTELRYPQSLKDKEEKQVTIISNTI